MFQLHNGPPLWMECWATYQRTLQENQRLTYAMTNYLQEEMAPSVGLPRMGPRLQVPLPTYVASAPVTMNTTNNIHVAAGSQVGQINSGALVYLDRAVTSFNSTGSQDLAVALRDFTQQVVDSQDISADQQRQVLELLQVLVDKPVSHKHSVTVR